MRAGNVLALDSLSGDRLNGFDDLLPGLRPLEFELFDRRVLRAFWLLADRGRLQPGLIAETSASESPREAETRISSKVMPTCPECGAQEERREPAFESAAQLTCDSASKTQPTHHSGLSCSSRAAVVRSDGRNQPSELSQCRIALRASS